MIGSLDDFETVEDLVAYFDQERTGLNASKFSVAADTEEVALLIGRGIAFSSDWCADGTLSTIREKEN